MYDVAIIGGGLSGLINGIVLARHHHKILLLEKKSFPFQRVCGEYISNEVRPFLQELGCYPSHLSPSQISIFQLTSVTGRSVETKLNLGGFGISRYKFDEFLASKALQEGVDLRTETSVSDVTFDGEAFTVTTSKDLHLESRVVIGAFGKRSILDKTMSRHFIKKRSPYIGVKYHIKTEMAEDLVALHNFTGGYCGISKIENEKFNLCYLASRNVLRQSGNIQTMEKNILMTNPWLKNIFNNSEFLFEQPEVINEVSFAQKEPVYNHILMTGDAAGMIAPLCGNGMAMAIHAAKISSSLVSEYLKGRISREEMEDLYQKKWRDQFAGRLWFGRKIQKLFGSGRGSEFAVTLLKNSKLASNLIIEKTHGKPFGLN